MMPTLLVVEDEQNIRRFVSANLKARGYHVLEADSAEQGLAQLYEHKPAAMILDIKLPGMSGWRMLKQMADDPRLPDIPVIVMTASPLNEQPDELAYQNVVERLVKPLSANELITAVKKTLG